MASGRTDEPAVPAANNVENMKQQGADLESG